jgi:hypothetical protein
MRVVVGYDVRVYAEVDTEGFVNSVSVSTDTIEGPDAIFTMKSPSTVYYDIKEDESGLTIEGMTADDPLAAAFEKALDIAENGPPWPAWTID